MKITVDSKIGDVVALDYRTATIFENYKIDFVVEDIKQLGILAGIILRLKIWLKS